MTEKEKVINGLESTAGYFRHLQTVGFLGDQPVFREHEAHCNDAIAMLKEQEAVEPIKLENWWKCPSCSGNIVSNMKYCPGCGRMVKWDDI